MLDDKHFALEEHYYLSCSAWFMQLQQSRLCTFAALKLHQARCLELCQYGQLNGTKTSLYAHLIRT